MTSRHRISVVRLTLAIPYVVWCALVATSINWVIVPLTPFRVTADSWRTYPLDLLILWMLTLAGTVSYGWLAFTALKKCSPALALIADIWLIVGFVFMVFLAICSLIGFRQT